MSKNQCENQPISDPKEAEVELCIEEKENEDKLFKEYFANHKKASLGPAANECKEMSEKDISNQIDKEI